MEWTGKLLGALLGFVITRRPMGVLIGMILGHLYDQYAAGRRAGPRPDMAAVRATFFRAAFTIMGHVAKSDGRVSEQDIAAARRIFRQFNLGDADTRAAMEFYSQGKQADFDAGAMGLLKQLLPQDATEVVNLASIGFCSEDVMDVLDETEGAGADVLVVYVGHNEFLDRNLRPLVQPRRVATRRRGGPGRAGRQVLAREAYEILGVAANAPTPRSSAPTASS
jgi:DnaJ like chaperone protein